MPKVVAQARGGTRVPKGTIGNQLLSLLRSIQAL